LLSIREAKTLFLKEKLYGAALFNHDSELLTVFEDIDRHNSVDKLIGH